MFTLQIKWNREFNYVNYKDFDVIEEAIHFGKRMQESGDGAEVKNFQVINENGEVVYPKLMMVESNSVTAEHPVDQSEIRNKYIRAELYLSRCRINAPSKLQPFHCYHGREVIVAAIGDKCVATLLDDLDKMTQFEIDRCYLVKLAGYFVV